MKNDKTQWEDLDIYIKTHELKIRISKSNLFTIYEGFIKKASFVSKQYKFVILGYSKSNNAIIFDFRSEDMDNGCLPLINNKNPKFSIRINAKPFFRHFDLDINQIKGCYLPKLVNIHNIGEIWAIFL